MSVKISNIMESWIEKLPSLNYCQGDSFPIFPDNLAVRSIDRFIKGWTGGKPGIYQHMFMLPLIHNDRTYKISIAFICHRDSPFEPQVCELAIEVWRHKKPKWVVMHKPPFMLKKERARDANESKLHKLYDDKVVEEVYNLLLFEKEKELVNMILEIDYQV